MINPQNSDKKVIKTAGQLISVGLFILFSVQVSAQNGTVNFSGNWALNESKSKLGDGPFKMAASTLNVNQDKNNLSIEKAMSGPDGQEMKMTAKYTMDGKECKNQGMMDMQTESTVTWSDNKKSVTIASITILTMNGDNIEMKATEIWKLDGDKTLKIDATNDTPNGEIKTSLVYDKK
jgi:hypothetical protein